MYNQLLMVLISTKVGKKIGENRYSPIFFGFYPLLLNSAKPDREESPYRVLVSHQVTVCILSFIRF